MSESRQPRILVVDDDEDVLFAARLLLDRHAGEVRTTTDPDGLPSLLREEHFDLILLDMNFTRDTTSGGEGFHWLGRIQEIAPAAIVILITAFADVDIAVRAIKAGAADFVVKPWQNEKLLATVNAALNLSRSRREVRSLRSRQERLAADLDEPYQDFVGQSPPIQRVRELVAKVAATDANVLLTGDNGTGKELVARALHRQSARAQEVFVRVDLGALSESLFESELFGHVRGAFTDAKSDRPGRFELASGGTILLDEIGNLSGALQTKLLTVIQSRQVTPVGSSTPRAVDVRLICASNVSLPDLVAQGGFREDLLYRINTVEITISPLRQRREDIPLLARHFLGVYARKYRKQIDSISQLALDRLMAYPWPGNVRELQHAIERAVILTSSSTLQPADFLLVEPRPSSEESLVLDTFDLEELERRVIRIAMTRLGGNVSRVAAELGISRPSLYRRLNRYGL